MLIPPLNKAMLKIPYVAQEDPHSCALACYTMTAKFFFPKTTAKDIERITHWKPGYAVWAFKFWLWIMERDITIEDYDTIDYKIWAQKGFAELQKSLGQKEYEYYLKRTFDIDEHQKDIEKVLAHKNFTYHRKKPKFEKLDSALQNGKICEVTLNSGTLREKSVFSPHRVVVLGTNDNEIIFHDPIKNYGPKCTALKTKFKHAWLETMGEPELCIYSRK